MRNPYACRTCQLTARRAVLLLQTSASLAQSSAMKRAALSIAALATSHALAPAARPRTTISKVRGFSIYNCLQRESNVIGCVSKPADREPARSVAPEFPFSSRRNLINATFRARTPQPPRPTSPSAVQTSGHEAACRRRLNLRIMSAHGSWFPSIHVLS